MLHCYPNGWWKMKNWQQNINKENNVSDNNKKEIEMVNKNVVSLIAGIILILIGMSVTSISLLSLGIKSAWNFPPLLFFILGIFLAYLGASGKWH